MQHPNELRRRLLLAALASPLAARAQGISTRPVRFILGQTAATTPDLIARTLLLKGAIIGPLYRSLRHRIMGDFDLVVAQADTERLTETLIRHGYSYSPGGFGRPVGLCA